MSFDVYIYSWNHPQHYKFITFRSLSVTPPCLFLPSSFLSSGNYVVLSVTVGEFHFLKFHIYEISQYVHLEAVVGVSLLGSSVTVTSMLLCVGRGHSFLLLNAIPLYGCIKICLSIYMLTDMLTISHFGLLKIKFLWIFIYKSFFPVVLRYNWYTKICMKLYIWWFLDIYVSWKCFELGYFYWSIKVILQILGYYLSTFGRIQ